MRISDWSSDVCSSDLYEKLKRKIGDYATAAAAVVLTLRGGTCETASIALTNLGETPLYAAEAAAALAGTPVEKAAVDKAVALEIGRASCRERVCQYV